MQTKITTVIHHGIQFKIEYELAPINHKDAWEPCGDGVWVYCSTTNTIGRNHIGYCHELPYHYKPEKWNPKGNFHKVVASSKPLWVWWGDGCTSLKWGDSGIALPKLKNIKLCKNN